MDHYRRIYGLHRLQKPRRYPYIVFEYRVNAEFIGRKQNAYDYAYFTANHLTFLETIIKFGQSPFTKIRKMTQTMFSKYYKDSWTINRCGNHLQGKRSTLHKFYMTYI